MSTYKTTKTIEITDPNQLRVDIYADDWQMAGSKKSKKKGEGASSKQKENSSQQKMEKILAQNATITQNSFDELMNEENVQTSNTQANKMKQGDNQRKGDSELDDSSVDEWADETSSEEEDTSEESSDEQAEQLTQTFCGITHR